MEGRRLYLPESEGLPAEGLGGASLCPFVFTPFAASKERGSVIELKRKSNISHPRNAQTKNRHRRHGPKGRF